MKTKTLVNLSMFVFASAFLFISCSKSDPEPAQTHYLKFSPDALSYVQVAPGKYRIYRNSASSLLDSVVVTRSSVLTQDVPASTFTSPYKAQFFEMIYTKMNSSPATEWMKVEAGLIMPFPPYSSDNEPVNLWGRENTLHYSIGSIIPNVPGTMTRIVEGITYNNVVALYSDAGVDINHPAYRKMAYYFVKNTGLIERQTITTGGAVKTYYLVRNN